MRKITCIGYEGHVCGKTVEKTGQNQKRCFECARENRPGRTRIWRQARPEYDQQRKWYYEHLEHVSVRSHWRYIFKGTSGPSYVGMPFFDAWNPDKGGSFDAGAQWIIENIGKRPEGCSLHIVEHEKGFVPGNLEWAHPQKQSAQKMFKIIADQRHEIRLLRARLQELEQAA